MITKDVCKIVFLIIEKLEKELSKKGIEIENIQEIKSNISGMNKDYKYTEDLMEESFNAAREMVLRPDFDLDKHDPSEMYVRKFETFEDYFKTLKTE